MLLAVSFSITTNICPSMKVISKRNSICAALALSAASSAFATPFTFGVMGDTQWSGTDSTGNNINSVAVNQAKACNDQFVKAAVDFVVQVGDLTDNGSTAGLQTRLDANSALTNAGIAFYGLRGNHEDTTAAQTFFNNNYVPTSSSAATVAVDAGTSNYSVTYKGTKIVLLDILTADSTGAMDQATTWMGSQLSAADHTQAFVFDHKNLLGQNHKDNAFGSSNDANPTQQNAFISTVASNNVKYVISGHDHMDYRSQVTSPDGKSSVQEIITASDSYKYYTPGTPFSPRDQSISEQLNKTGYYLYTVDGPRVTGKYYATTPLANGDVAPNPVWTLTDKFGYSLNGTSKQVAQGASYKGITHTIAAGTSYGESGYVGTTMNILNGTNGSTLKTADGRALTKDVELGWAARASGPAKAQSDVLTIWGMSDLGNVDKTDTFALSLSFAASGISADALSSYYIASKDANGNWINSVDLNNGGTKNFVVGAYSDTYGLGTYGIDTATNTAWAVVNQTGGDFVVIPEPSTYAAILGALTISFVAIRRRRVRQAV
jgi:hypothetical protein